MKHLKELFIAGWGSYPLIGTSEQVVDGLIKLSAHGARRRAARAGRATRRRCANSRTTPIRCWCRPACADLSSNAEPPSRLPRLDGKVAVVTGAAAGPKAALGAIFAKALAAEGAKVVLADTKDCASVAAEITANGRHGACRSRRRARREIDRRHDRRSRKAIRPARHPGQQRCHRLEHSADRDRGDRRRAVGRVHDRERARHVSVRESRDPGHAAQRLRQDHQSVVDHHAVGPFAPAALCHHQGRHRGDDALDGARARCLRHPGEFAGAWPGDERLRSPPRWRAGRACTNSC